MHVAATNIILWIRTLVKETIEEITEVEEEHLNKMEHEHEHGHETVNKYRPVARGNLRLLWAKQLFFPVEMRLYLLK